MLETTRSGDFTDSDARRIPQQNGSQLHHFMETKSSRGFEFEELDNCLILCFQNEEIFLIFCTCHTSHYHLKCGTQWYLQSEEVIWRQHEWALKFLCFVSHFPKYSGVKCNGWKYSVGLVNVWCLHGNMYLLFPPFFQVWILCNDCGNSGEVVFHIVGQKCQGCGSYNTRSTCPPTVEVLPGLERNLIIEEWSGMLCQWSTTMASYLSN
jgi:hypothetical protein